VASDIYGIYLQLIFHPEAVVKKIGKRQQDRRNNTQNNKNTEYIK
jgi:hypothetical protein